MRLRHRATASTLTRRLQYGAGLLAAGATTVIGTAASSTASTPADGQSGVVPVAAAPAQSHHGVLPMRQAGSAAPAVSTGTLHYQNGPTQHASAVYLVYWGSQWNSDSNGVQSYMNNLFNGLGTSSDAWSRVTSQYTDSSGAGPTFSGAELRGSWVDSASAAPSKASASAISSEANKAASHFGVSGPNVQIVVLSPSGTHPDGFPNTGFCAWHDYNGKVPYTNMPYVLDAGSSCGANSVRSKLDGFSIVEGHEYAETLTDPEPPSGYVASDGEENGDLCAWKGLGAIGLPTGTFAMQPTWSNKANGCAMS
ncbi:MAG: hypothetical protein FWE75_07315 [Actinomycetia bacterium]|nr:hypothetical protein [Actinomycetes bacterium]